MALPPFGLRFKERYPAVSLALEHRVEICNDSIWIDYSEWERGFLYENKIQLVLIDFK